DSTETCDTYQDSYCNSCSSCFNSYPLLNGKCTYCGDGIIQSSLEINETCDTNSDSNCNADCQSCKNGYSVVNGKCAFCGDGSK
ncbi:MAG TPA: hypothetical protein PLD02_16445, partial [Saprospiraceae bacterium]|nr:hypothetical protein [Saprospiraceae bacterium]